MKKNIVFCDHCGAELDAMHDMIDITIDLGSSWFDTDLCDECWQELKYKVDKFCSKVDDNNA